MPIGSYRTSSPARVGSDNFLHAPSPSAGVRFGSPVGERCLIFSMWGRFADRAPTDRRDGAGCCKPRADANSESRSTW